MLEDFVHGNATNPLKRCLEDISLILQSCNKDLLSYLPNICEEAEHQNSVDDLGSQALGASVPSFDSLTIRQKEVGERILESVYTENRRRDNVFFVDGPGGTGKTTLYRAVMARLRSVGRLVLAVAPTGIAATLLEGGRTVHSTFGVPLRLIEGQSRSSINKDSRKAAIIRSASLIIWDEAPMSDMGVIKVVDEFLKDIHDNQYDFGGKTIVFGGDFRQCAPVKVNASRASIVAQSLIASSLWNRMRKFSLTENLRLEAGSQEFHSFLLQLGEGRLPAVHVNQLGDPLIEISARFVKNSKEDLISFVFPETISLSNPDVLRSAAILSPKNEYCFAINDYILQRRVVGSTKTYISEDCAIEDEETDNFVPLEYLHSQTPTGMPPHILTLKVGAVIMLLRNLDPLRGLCNGTRLIVTRLHNNVIHSDILSGTFQGEHVMIPRIINLSTDDGASFRFKRTQFPVRIAFAMTINKSQGQTFDRVGLYLKEPVFSHGQLYVAFSRVRNEGSIGVYVKDSPQQPITEGKVTTLNVVYPEMFSFLNVSNL